MSRDFSLLFMSGWNPMLRTMEVTVFEALLGIRKNGLPIAGMGEVLFHGLVPASEFINAEALYTAVGYPVTRMININEPWLSFSMDNKRLMVAKKAFSYRNSWLSIYEKGLAYGRDDTGPAGLSYTGLVPTVQSKKVTINGKTYRVRLPRGYPSNPTANVTGWQHALTMESEWDRLFYSICAGRPGAYTGPVHANFTRQELGLVNNTAGEGFGGYSWCQEQHGFGADYRVCRGFYDPVQFYRERIGLGNDGWGFRPVLELI